MLIDLERNIGCGPSAAPSGRGVLLALLCLIPAHGGSLDRQRVFRPSTEVHIELLASKLPKNSSFVLSQYFSRSI